MLSGNGSGWARIEYRDFAGILRLSVQGVAPGDYAVGFCAGHAPVLCPGIVTVDAHGKGTAVLDFAFRNISACRSLGLLITDGRTELSAVKGRDRTEDLRFALRQRKASRPAAHADMKISSTASPSESSVPKPERRYYDTVKEYMDELFQDYSADEDVLRERVPYSRWKRVEYNDKGGHCLVGLVGSPEDENRIRYICYGVPGAAAEKVTPALSDYCQFIPDETGKAGWWMMYQDAETGETIVI